jgi:hypothetical protein
VIGLSYGSAGRPMMMIGKHSRELDPVSLPTKNIENNPMQSSRVVAGICDATATFDTSGKSAALI